MQESYLYHFDRLQFRIESGFGRTGGLLEATRVAPRNSNRGNSNVSDFPDEANKAIEILLPPNFRHGTLFAYAQHPKLLSLNIFNNLFFRAFHLISGRTQEFRRTAMSQVESYTQRTMRHYATSSLMSNTDGPISNPRYLFDTSSPQSLSKAPPDPPPGGPLETSGDGEAH